MLVDEKIPIGFEEEKYNRALNCKDMSTWFISAVPSVSFTHGKSLLDATAARSTVAASILFSPCSGPSPRS